MNSVAVTHQDEQSRWGLRRYAAQAATGSGKVGINGFTGTDANAIRRSHNECEATDRRAGREQELASIG